MDLAQISRDAPVQEFLNAVRTRLNARSLLPDAEVMLPSEAVARLLALANAATPGPQQIGIKGYMRAAGIDDASGEYVAHIAFHDQETAHRAGALIFADVMLEPVMETPAAANQEPNHAS